MSIDKCPICEDLKRENAYLLDEIEGIKAENRELKDEINFLKNEVNRLEWDLDRANIV